MNSKPYVGVTGPVTLEETLGLRDVFLDTGYSFGSPHVPMIGFLASYKTLQGQRVKNRRYPPVSEIPAMARSVCSDVLTMVHYNSRDESSLSGQVASLFEVMYDRNWCRALQLNIVWPNRAEVATIKRQHPDMSIVFQASRAVLDSGSPREIVSNIKAYDGSIDYVLFDPSGGRGIPFPLHGEELLAMYGELQEQMPHVTVGFAGGFTGENVALRVESLMSATGSSDFCIDAEGGLRDKVTNAYGDDTLNMEKARYYLLGSSLMLP